MFATYSPQGIDDVDVQYTFNGDTITVTLDGRHETFAFSDLPDGEATSIASTLDPCPVLSARRVHGVLHVTLLRAVPPRPQTDDEAELDAWRALWTAEQLPSDLMDEPSTGDTPRAVIEWRPQSEIDAEREAAAWAAVRAERDRRIEAVEWARRRHLDEHELGLPTTLTGEQYTELLGYIQAERDVPQNNEDPYNVERPAVPDFLL